MSTINNNALFWNEFKKCNNNLNKETIEQFWNITSIKKKLTTLYLH